MSASDTTPALARRCANAGDANSGAASTGLAPRVATRMRSVPLVP